jgi:hypothetical protein
VRRALWAIFDVAITVVLTIAFYAVVVFFDALVLKDSECANGSGCTWLGNAIADGSRWIVVAACLVVGGLLVFVARPFRR